MNTCYVCNKQKDISEFKKRCNMCKECHAAYGKEWRRKNKEKISEYMLNYYSKNMKRIKEYNSMRRKSRIDYIRNKVYFSKYGITYDEKIEMIKNQNNKCLICSGIFGSIKQACVDHSHKNGKIRGILCHSCNRGIGLLNEDIGLFNKIIEYIQINDR